MAVLWIAYPWWVQQLRRAVQKLDWWVARIEARTVIYTNSKGERRTLRRD